MANSTAGAVKALIETAGLGLAAYADRPPRKDLPRPYCIIRTGPINPEPAFNPRDDPEGHVAEQVLVELWEDLRDDEGARVESFTLADQLARLFRGNRLPTAPTHVSGVTLTAGPVRLPEEVKNLVHHSYTLTVRRVLERS